MLSDIIEKMLVQMLEEEGGSLELKRNELAERIGCVPSQINYVITSRFTPERGYIIESRRGGGGYVRITKKLMHKDEYLMHLFYSIGDTLDEKSAGVFIIDLAQRGIITSREANIMGIASAYAVSGTVRANLIKKIILSII